MVWYLGEDAMDGKRGGARWFGAWRMMFRRWWSGVEMARTY